MSSSPEARHRKASRYVADLLALNPAEESSTIISRRNRVLRLSPQTSSEKVHYKTAASDPRVERQAFLEQIEAVRRDFWSAPLEQLQATLQEIDSKSFPDLQAAVNRLSVVANNRDQLPLLTEKNGYDAGFFRVFRDVLIASPRDSAIDREKMVAQCSKRKTRKRAAKMIRLIQQEAPALYRLEADWLDSLTKQKYSAKSIAKRKDDTWAMNNDKSIPWWIWLVFFLIVRVVIKAVSMSE